MQDFEVVIDKDGETIRYFGIDIEGQVGATRTESAWLSRDVWLCLRDPAESGGIHDSSDGLHMSLSSDDGRKTFWVTSVKDESGGKITESGGLLALICREHSFLDAELRSLKIEELDEAQRAVWQQLEDEGLAERFATPAEETKGVWNIWRIPKGKTRPGS